MFYFIRDYRAIPELDRYRAEDLDDNEYSELSMSERLAAERELRKRDHDEAVATGRIRPGILYGTALLLLYLKYYKFLKIKHCHCLISHQK